MNSTFVANLVATFLGVLLATLLARHSERRSESTRLARERGRLRELIQLISKSIDANAGPLAALKETAEKGGCLVETQLDTATWYAIRKQFVELRPHEAIVTKIFRYYATLEAVERVHQGNVRSVTRTHFGSDRTTGPFRTMLLNLVIDALKDGATLRLELTRFD